MAEGMGPWLHPDSPAVPSPDEAHVPGPAGVPVTPHLAKGMGPRLHPHAWPMHGLSEHSSPADPSPRQISRPLTSRGTSTPTLGQGGPWLHPHAWPHLPALFPNKFRIPGPAGLPATPRCPPMHGVSEGSSPADPSPERIPRPWTTRPACHATKTPFKGWPPAAVEAHHFH